MQKQKIALLTTSLLDLGIRSLKAVLDNHGIQTQLYLLDSASSGYTNKELNQITDSLVNFDPAVIGVSTLEYSLSKSRQILKLIKSTPILKNKLSVIGGLGASLAPEDYIDFTDVIVIGEAEEIFLELIRKYLNNEEFKDIKNLWIKNPEGIIKTANQASSIKLDSLPMSYYGAGAYLLRRGALLKLKEGVFWTDYKPWRHESIFLFESRGCVHSCSYCIYGASSPFYRKHVEKRKIGQIIDYLVKMKECNPSLKLVHMIENDFLLRSESEIAEFVREYKNKISLPFFIYCTPESVTDAKVRLLEDSGIRGMIMGIQSGSERINKNIYNRGITNQRALEATKIINRYAHKIKPLYDFIINNPYEKRKDIVETINLIRKISKPFILANHCLVFSKGTDSYNTALKDGKLKNNHSSLASFDYHKVRHYLTKDNNLYLNSFMFWLERMQVGLWKHPNFLKSKAIDFFISPKLCSCLDNLPALILFFNKVLSAKDYFGLLGKKISRFLQRRISFSSGA